MNEAVDGQGLTARLYEEIQAKVDRVNEAVERLQAGDFSALTLEQTQTLTLPPVIERDATMRLLTALEQQGTQRLLLAQHLLAEATQVPTASSNTQTLAPVLTPEARIPEPAAPEAGQPRSLIRVAADSVDVMVNQAGEVNIARSRVEGEMRFLRNSFNDLTQDRTAAPAVARTRDSSRSPVANSATASSVGRDRI